MGSMADNEIVTLADLGRAGMRLDRSSDEESGWGTHLQLAEQILCVRDRMGQNRPLKGNRAQREFERTRKQHNIVLKARQMGMSTWIAGRFFLRTITHPGTVTVQVAHTQEAAEMIFRIARRFLRCLPTHWREGALSSARENAQQIIFPALDSEYRVETAGDRNAGRGLTITHLHCSELARWPGDAAETLQGLRAALSPRGEMVLESTPMGASGCFWREWQDAERTGIARHFFPWWWEERYVADAVEEASLTDAERALMERHQVNLSQIGYRRQLQANFRALTKQEYAEDANECFLSSGDCVFDTEAIDARMREVSAPVKTRLQGRLQIWYMPVAERRYVVAADPAGGGTAGDYSAAQVLDIETGLQCAELQAKLTTLELAHELAGLGREYNQALLVVERNNHGSGVLAYLQSVCRYPAIYAENGNDGWLTTSTTRARVLAGLGSALVESSGIFSSERLLNECRSFVRHLNGRTEAQAGEHDDCVMAMAIGLAARNEVLLMRRVS
jgi:hypothetical protein